MANYLGTECPYCNKVTKITDDIAVCPICGTPHHRDCYMEHGSCFNESLHESGFEWVPPNKGINELNSIICSHCDHSIPQNSTFCNYCGSLVLSNETERSPIFLNQSLNSQPERFDLEEKIDEIPIKHWVTYIGKNYNYYVNRFKLQDTLNRKTSFTLSAVIFPSLFFLYRKIWGAAIISAVLNFLLGLPSLIMMFFMPLGINFGINSLALERISDITSIISLILNLSWGLFAAWLYRRKASAKINKIKESSTSESEFHEKLAQTSGPSVIAPIIGGTVITILAVIMYVVTGFFEFLKLL